MRTDPRLFSTFVSVALAIVLAAPVEAADSLHFGYQEVPGGSYRGTFHAEGTVPDLTAFPPGGSGGVHAVQMADGGKHTLLIVGGFENADSSGDVAFVLLQSDEPFAPGVYPVDPGSFSAVFGFADDAIGVEIPQDPSGVNWGEYAGAIVAAHKFVGISGVITLNVVTDDFVSGSFAGAMIATNLTKTVAVTNGAFAAGTDALSLRPLSWGRVKAEYRD